IFVRDRRRARGAVLRAVVELALDAERVVVDGGGLHLAVAHATEEVVVRDALTVVTGHHERQEHDGDDDGEQQPRDPAREPALLATVGAALAHAIAVAIGHAVAIWRTLPV